jgi:hypothetical protein
VRIRFEERDLEQQRKGSGKVSKKTFGSEDEQAKQVVLFFLFIYFLKAGLEEGMDCSFCLVFNRVVPLFI